jgi:hypothetical protein
MKKWMGMALLLVAGGISLAADKHPKEMTVVLVSVHFNIGNPPAQIVFRAKGLASQMFAGAGVGIIWHSHLQGANRNLQPILIDIAPNSPERFNRGILAFTQPFGGNHVTIFWDRLKGTYNDTSTTALLAHVLVHEITHILQRSDHHSSEGIMKAYWTPKDILQMMWEPLSFDCRDIELIHAGLTTADRPSDHQR